jgi:hypothetical protein
MLKPIPVQPARIKTVPTWRIYSQWAGHASYLGVVSAPNPRTAVERAIQQFKSPVQNIGNGLWPSCGTERERLTLTPTRNIVAPNFRPVAFQQNRGASTSHRRATD